MDSILDKFNKLQNGEYRNFSSFIYVLGISPQKFFFVQFQFIKKSHRL